MINVYITPQGPVLIEQTRRDHYEVRDQGSGDLLGVIEAETRYPLGRAATEPVQVQYGAHLAGGMGFRGREEHAISEVCGSRVHYPGRFTLHQAVLELAHLVEAERRRESAGE